MSKKRKMAEIRIGSPKRAVSMARVLQEINYDAQRLRDGFVTAEELATIFQILGQLNTPSGEVERAKFDKNPAGMTMAG